MNRNEVENIFEINVKKKFTLEQVNELVLVIVKITETTQVEARRLTNLLTALPDKSSQKALELETEIKTIVDRWYSKVEKLGGVPKGLWLVDFDFGMGYFCWKFPENRISFWHGYQDGFSGRKEIGDLIF